MDQIGSDRQLNVLRLYGELVCDREDWSGGLVLAYGHYAEIVPAAVSIANGTTLWLTANAAEAKLALRRGEVDFIVNTLDEAMRALKNEIRQGRPLGVVLTGDMDATLAEMTARGLLPDKVIGDSVAMNSDMILRDRRYSAYRIEADSLQELRKIDAQLLAALAEEDIVRRRWLQRASRYLRTVPGEGRWVWLKEDEYQSLPASWNVSPGSR